MVQGLSHFDVRSAHSLRAPGNVRGFKKWGRLGDPSWRLGRRFSRLELLEGRRLLAHDLGLFELDGNTADDAAAGIDAEQVYEQATGIMDHGIPVALFEADEANATIFTGGGSKDTNDIPNWNWTDGSVPDKDDLLNAFATAFIYTGAVDGVNQPGDFIIYGGTDRFATNGSSQIGIWLFQDDVALNEDGTFSGMHQVGDILILVDFVVGGTIPNIDVLIWNGSTVEALGTASDCSTIGGPDIGCSIVNSAALPGEPPWTYLNKDGGTSYDVGAYYEGGMNLSAFFRLPGTPDASLGCFSSALFETRSSHSVNAQLKDFVLGEFETCELIVDKTGPELGKVGDDATYEITIENSGLVPLFPQSITDTLLGDLGSDPDSGDDGDGVLEPGEAWFFEVTRTVQMGDPDPLPNTVTAVFNTASDGTGDEVSGSDSHSVNLFQPSITISKTADRSSAAVGDIINYDYEVENSGSSDSPALENVVVVDDNGTPGDDGDDFSPTFVDGDTNGDGLLDLGETWTYTASRLVVAGDADPLVNTVEVTSNPVGFPNLIEDETTASVELFQPAISIEKSGDPLSKVGDDVTYTYTVTNAGSSDSPALDNVVLVDDNGTPADQSDDFSPAFVGGDTNGDGLLDLGETWTYEATRTIPNGASDPFVNTATVTATPLGSVNSVDDSDTHSVELFQPAVEVVKTGPTDAAVGETITYNFTINNLSSADGPNLILDTVTDTVLGNLTATASANGCGTLVTPDGTCNFTVEYTVQAMDPDPLVNVVTVHYHPENFPNDVTDDDDHSVDLRIIERGRVVPTGTTCSQFVDHVLNGNPDDPSDDNGFADGGFNYTGKGNKIINVADPGAAFYFTLIEDPSNEFTVGVVQESDPAGKPLMDLTDLQVIGVNEISPGLFACDVTIAGNIDITDAPNPEVTLDGDTLGFDLTSFDFLALRWRIDPKSIIGEPDPKMTYTLNFSTTVDGVVVDSDPDGVLVIQTGASAALSLRPVSQSVDQFVAGDRIRWLDSAFLQSDGDQFPEDEGGMDISTGLDTDLVDSLFSDWPLKLKRVSALRYVS